MNGLAGIILAVAGLAVLVWLQRREKARLRLRRQDILADCLPLLDSGAITLGPDGFPRLSGHIGRDAVRADLLPDTLTLRRLPQLWLSLTILTPMPCAASLGVLVRPSGNEFYARTPDLPDRLPPPPDFPVETLVRGNGAGGMDLLARLRGPLASLLQDPKVKEVVVTPMGLRVVYQVAEGLRGQHLLLRQCDFGDARLDAALFLQLHDGLQALAATLSPPSVSKSSLRA